MVQGFAPAPRRSSKKVLAASRARRFAAALQDCQVQCSARSRAVARGRGALTPPPSNRPPPPFTRVCHTGPFWPAYGAISIELQFQVRAPPAMAPWQPHHNAGDPL